MIFSELYKWPHLKNAPFEPRKPHSTLFDSIHDNITLPHCHTLNPLHFKASSRMFESRDFCRNQPSKLSLRNDYSLKEKFFHLHSNTIKHTTVDKISAEELRSKAVVINLFLISDQFPVRTTIALQLIVCSDLQQWHKPSKHYCQFGSSINNGPSTCDLQRRGGGARRANSGQCEQGGRVTRQNDVKRFGSRV